MQQFFSSRITLHMSFDAKFDIVYFDMMQTSNCLFQYIQNVWLYPNPLSFFSAVQYCPAMLRWNKPCMNMCSFTIISVST